MPGLPRRLLSRRPLSRRPLSRRLLLALVAGATLFLAPLPAPAAAVFELEILDGAGEGFYDPTPRVPAGGNPGTTLGEARQNALNAALAIWAQTLDSPVPIHVSARFEPLAGTSQAGALGFGGAGYVVRDFAGAPQPGTWYPAALADRLAGVDLGDAGEPDLRLTFNSDVDGPLVLGDLGFDYGFDHRAPERGASFLHAALHELAHGLGIASTTDLATGAELSGYDDAYLRHVERVGFTPPELSAMSDAERRAAFSAAPAVRWAGSEVGAAATSLSAGADASGRVELFAPQPFSAAAIHHLATTVQPRQLMAPSISAALDLESSLRLTRAMLGDLGWGPVPATVTTTGGVLLEAPFDSGGLAGWTFADFGPLSGPSQWAITNGVLAQTANIYGDQLRRGTHAVWSGGAYWTDVQIQLQIWSTDDDFLGVAFRYLDADNFYAFEWDKETGTRRLVKVEDGTRSVLAQSTGGYRSNDVYWIEISAAGSQLSVRADGTTLLAASDSAHGSGTVALTSYGNAGSYFDNLRVSEPRPSPPVLLADDFSDNNLTGWTKQDFGTSSAPGSWSASQSNARQTSQINADPQGLIRGTLLAFDNGTGWSDLRLGVELWTTDQNTSQIYFRYRDPQNFYRFEWNRQSAFRRLLKVENGVRTDLAADAVVYDTTDHYWIEVEARGSTLAVAIDGRTVLTATDSAHESGTVAFGTHANGPVYFDNLIVHDLTASGGN